jgi:xylulokinase
VTLALGLDVGATGVKGILISQSGTRVAAALAPHDLHSTRQGWAEEHPADWWAGIFAVTRELLPAAPGGASAVGSVAVNGMVPALVLLDEAGAVLRPSIQQNDARA